MPRPMIQDGHEAREMTSSEYAEHQELQADVAARAAAADAISAARVSARAKLAALGLTEAEVAALLGV